MDFRKVDLYESILPIVKIIGIFSVVIFTSYAFGAFDSDEEKKLALIEKQNILSEQIISSATGKILAKEESLLKLNEEVLLLNYDISRLNKCVTYNKARSGSLDLAKQCELFEGDVKSTQEIKTTEKKKALVPDELFYTTKLSDKCYVSQTEKEHQLPKNGGMLATDVACGFKAETYAPDYISESFEYTVKVKEDKLLGQYIELYFSKNGQELKWIVGHTRTKLKDGDKVKTGERIGEMNLSGATTGYHTHIELWTIVLNNWTNITYTTSSKVLNNRRNNVYENQSGNKIFLTTYDLGSTAQNDTTPCIGASGKDLCKLAAQGKQTIALTVDMRKKLGVKFGDSITLVGKDFSEHKVQVHDEMNARFRYSCIKKEGVCIKGDIARYQGEAKLASGVYSIKVN